MSEQEPLDQDLQLFPETRKYYERIYGSVFLPGATPASETRATRDSLAAIDEEVGCRAWSRMHM
jgi:hypothetical protein